MSKVIFFRGLPGAGKTTLSRALCNVTLSADDFFVGPDGVYRFDLANIREAHNQCRTNLAAAIRLGISAIGVANTFTAEWEIEPYLQVVEQLQSEGYQVQIFSVVVENRHGGKSFHGVPDEIMVKFRDRFHVVL